MYRKEIPDGFPKISCGEAQLPQTSSKEPGTSAAKA